MLDRIKLLMEYKSLTASQFADAMEVPRAVVSHVLSGRNKPSLDVIIKIASTYSDVNLDWLLLGNGEMLNTLAVHFPEHPLEVAAEDELPQEDQVANNGRHEPDIVQKRLADVGAADQAKENTRSIKQVMMFYSDGTFETFKPSE